MSFLTPQVMEYVDKFGFGILMFVLLVMVIGYILRQQAKILADANKERENWQKIIELERQATIDSMSQITRALETHNSRAKEYHKQIRDAHNFQREEHIKIMDGLNRVVETLGVMKAQMESNFERFKMEHKNRENESGQVLAALRELTKNCQEHTRTLARINGRMQE